MPNGLEKRFGKGLNEEVMRFDNFEKVVKSYNLEKMPPKSPIAMQLGFFLGKILSTFPSFECRIMPCDSKLKTRNSKLEEILGEQLKREVGMSKSYLSIIS